MRIIYLFIYRMSCDHSQNSNLCSCSLCFWWHRSMFQMNMLYVPLSGSREQGAGHRVCVSEWSSAVVWQSSSPPGWHTDEVMRWNNTGLDWDPDDHSRQSLNSFLNKLIPCERWLFQNPSAFHLYFLTLFHNVTCSRIVKTLVLSFLPFLSYCVCDSWWVENAQTSTLHVCAFIWCSYCTDCTVYPLWLFKSADCVLKVDFS